MATELAFVLGVDTAAGTVGIINFSKTLQQMGQTADQVNKQAAASADMLSFSLNNVQTAAKYLGITFTGLAVANQIREMTSASLDFQQSMANVATLLNGTGVSTKDLSDKILQLDGNLGSSTELANALYEAISAGVEPAKAIDFITTSTKLAKAELFDTGEATKLLATVMNAYGNQISDVAHVSDVLTQTINVGIVRGNELAGAFGKVTSTAAEAHVSFEEVAASIAIMTRAGIDADTASTALNQALLSFIHPSEQSRELAKSLGIELNATTLETKGFYGALQDVSKATGGNIELINTLFENVRAGKAVMALTGAQGEAFIGTLDHMRTAVGDSTAAFMIQQDTIKSQWTIAWNDAQRVLDQFVTTNRGPVVDALKEANREMENNAGGARILGDLFAMLGGKAMAGVDALKYLAAQLPIVGKYFDDGAAATAAATKEHEANKAAAESNAKTLASLREEVLKGTDAYKKHTASAQELIDKQKAAEEAAKNHAKAVDQLVLSVTGQDEKQKVLLDTLNKLVAAHVPLSEIVQKLGKQTVEYAATLTTLPPIVADVVRGVQAEDKARQDALATILRITDANKAALSDEAKWQKTVDDGTASVATYNGALLKTIDYEEDLLQHIQSFSGQFPTMIPLWQAGGLAITDAFGDAADKLSQLAPIVVDTTGKSTAAMQKMHDEVHTEIVDLGGKFVTFKDGVIQNNKTAADTMRQAWATTMGQVTADISKGLADVIFNGGSFSDTMIGIAKKTASGMFEAFLAGLLTPLTSKLADLGKQAATIFSGATSAAGSAGGSAAGAIGGSGGSGAIGGLGGLIGGLGGGLISGGLSLLGDARMEGTLNAIEYNTRATYINEAIAIDRCLTPILQTLTAMAPDNAATYKPYTYGENGQLISGGPQAPTSSGSGGTFDASSIVSVLQQILQVLQRGGTIEIDGRQVATAIGPALYSLNAYSGVQFTG